MTNGKWSKMKRKEAIAGYLFILPMTIGLGVFFYYAFVKNILLSFTYGKMMMPAKFVGFDNYKNLLTDKMFIASIKNTLVYVVGVVPTVIIISILLAVLLNTNIKGQSLIRTMIFFPLVTTPAAIAMTWGWILNTKFGLVNVILNSMGVEQISWLSNPDLIKLTCIFVIIWSLVGYNVIIMLAGLQNIPTVYYEAAKIDGAGPFRSFLNITLPLLTPSIYFVLVIVVIAMFKEFEIVFLMVPSDSFNFSTPIIEASRSMVRFFYDKGIRGMSEEGYAAAASVILFFIILSATVLINRTQKKWVFYE